MTGPGWPGGSEAEGVVEPLWRLAAGETARIVHIVAKDVERAVRLSSLGLVPGAVVRLNQKRPAVVLELGETTLALDASVSHDIYVRRMS